MVRELGLDGRGRLLDVGCGPGTLTIRLATLFDRAIGLDPDAAMLEHGRMAAAEGKRHNISWVRATAEELPAPAAGPFRVVTFGQSFHRTRELNVARVVYDILEPGGAVVMVAHAADGRPVPPNPGYPSIPHEELRELVIRYLGSTTRNGVGTAPVRNHRWQDILARTRFGMPQELFLPGIPDLLRDADTVIAGYLSMSWSAPHLYGDRLDDFVADAHALLAARSAAGLFWDWPGDTSIVIGRKADGAG